MQADDKDAPSLFALDINMSSHDHDSASASTIQIRKCDIQNPNDRLHLLSLIREVQTFECTLYDQMLLPDALGDEYLVYLERQCDQQRGQILFAQHENVDNAGNSVILGYAVVFTRVDSDDEIFEKQYQFGVVAELGVTSSARGRGIGRMLSKECEHGCQRSR
jgi:ribosomal protein S18 acetylase RimI-like enzyme